LNNVAVLSAEYAGTAVLQQNHWQEAAAMSQAKEGSKRKQRLMTSCTAAVIIIIIMLPNQAIASTPSGPCTAAVKGMHTESVLLALPVHSPM
jgi:hypothetical protein